MAEFASKGVAGSGLGLGIAGTALVLLNNGGNGGGVLGGLFGNNNQATISALQAENGMLKALYYLISIEKSGGVKYYEGASRPGAVNRKPYWTKGSGNKLTFNLLVDYTDNTPSFFGTGLNFKDGSSYFTSGDSFRLTRADTKEVIELFTGKYNLTTFYTSNTTTPFFHDLGQGDSVGIFFDPPPDGYL